MTAPRRYLALAIGLCCTTAFAMLACDDDPATPSGSGDSGVDASTTDGATGKDATATDGSVPIVDSGNDVTQPTNDAGTDASSPTTTEAIRSTGYIHITDMIAFAEFYADDTTVRWSNAPECLIVARSAAKTMSPAGTVTIGGDVVGQTGGPAEPLKLEAATEYVAVDTIFPATNEFTVDVDQGPASAGFAALPVQTLPTSLATPLVMLTPSADAGADAGALSIPTSKPYELTWTPPTGPGDLTNQRVILNLVVTPTSLETGKRLSLFCGFPLTAGKATIPSEVLKDLQARAGGGAAGGSLVFWAGGHRLITMKDATTYIIEVAREDSVADWTTARAVTLE